MKNMLSVLVGLAGLVSTVSAVEIINTDFTIGGGYSDNTDLAGQLSWKAASTSGSEAFQVNGATGVGYADTAAFSNSFDTTLGNGVYFDASILNEVAGEWRGSMDLTLSIDPVPGWTRTNTTDIYEGTNYVETITNSYDIAGTGYNDWFQFGLMTPDNTNNAIDWNSAASQSVLPFLVKGKGGNGTVNVTFDNNSTLFFTINYRDLGWDPSWSNASNTNGPDFETDPLTFNWVIRKASDDVYIGKIEVINDGVYTNESDWLVSSSVNTFKTSEFTMFGMSHDANADWGTYNGTTGVTNNGVQITLDSLYLEKLEDLPPATVMPPENLEAATSDGTVVLTWDEALESSGYLVKRYSDYEGGSEVLSTNVGSALEFPETGLDNGTTYFYTVTSDYGGLGMLETDPRLAARPLANGPLSQWGPSPDINASGFPRPTLTSTFETNLTDNSTVETFHGSHGSEDYVMWTAGTGSYNTNLETGGAPPLHGMVQTYTKPGLATFYLSNMYIKGDAGGDYIRLRGNNANGYASVLLWIENFAAFDMTDGSAYQFELVNTSMARGTADAAAHKIRAAVRNGTQWYVSETAIAAVGTLEIADMVTQNWATFTPPVLGATNMVTHDNNFTSRLLGNVTAFGFFHDAFKNSHTVSFKVVVGQAATPLQQWTDGFNIYNEDAAAGFDYDNDGLDNVYEWGLFGDPTDSGNTGLSPEAVQLDATGSNLIYIYPRLVDPDNRPQYFLEEIGNLTFGPWTNEEGTYDISAGGDYPGSLGEAEAVTNSIPTNLDAKFIQLQITE